MFTDRFKNRKEALVWLQDRGQISQGKFYQDCDRGYVEVDGRRITLTIHPDKTISKYQIMEYAEAVFGFSRQNQITIDLAEKKEKLEVEERELKVKKLKRDHERELGNVIDIDSAEQAMARKIVVIYEKIYAQVRRDQEEVLLRLGLPPSKGAALMSEMKGVVDRAFNEMRARKVFDIMIRGENDFSE